MWKHQAHVDTGWHFQILKCLFSLKQVKTNVKLWTYFYALKLLLDITWNNKFSGFTFHISCWKIKKSLVVLVQAAKLSGLEIEVLLWVVKWDWNMGLHRGGQLPQHKITEYCCELTLTHDVILEGSPKMWASILPGCTFGKQNISS